MECFELVALATRQPMISNQGIAVIRSDTGHLLICVPVGMVLRTSSYLAVYDRLKLNLNNSSIIPNVDGYGWIRHVV